MPPFVLSLLTTLLAMIWPAAPAWLPRIVVDIVPAVSGIVRALNHRTDLDNGQRANMAVTEVGIFLDGALDGIPEWSKLSESRRDRIINGLVELGLFLVQLADRPQGKRDVVEAVRRIKQGLPRTTPLVAESAGRIRPGPVLGGLPGSNEEE